jgi:hypothetical protein
MVEVKKKLLKLLLKLRVMTKKDEEVMTRPQLSTLKGVERRVEASG